jgi:UDP-N-acetylmuramyl tripeptide synthase
VSGLRADDMAVRLKYAGVESDLIVTESDTARALEQALERTPEGGRLYLLPTYTAMLDVRGSLASAGHASQFWED